MPPILDVAGVSKHFGGVLAVDELTFSVARGEILGLIGPNGAGKTTLFNLVSGHLRPTAGEIHFKGARITNAAPWDLVRVGLARTFQSTVLFSESSVLENVLRGFMARRRFGVLGGFLGSRQREDARLRDRALELIDVVELGAVIDERARNLPYGHQRALGVAIALATEPELVMLDEPVAGMNPEETEHMARVIRRVNEAGTTIVVVEHDMSFVMQLCQRIVVMSYGKKIAEGAPDEIRANDAVIAAYLGVDDDAVA